MVALLADNGIFTFISSGTWAVIRNLTLFFVVVFWLSVGFWVTRTRAGGSRTRGSSAWRPCSGSCPRSSGRSIYMLFRPPEYLDDVRERELEIKAMEQRLSRRGEMHCPVCRAEVEAAS